MSIIHDALKKAQEQRREKAGGVPYNNLPEVKKKPRIALIAVVAVLAAAVVAYLYIPAFHGQKVPPVNRATTATPAPVVNTQATPAPESGRKEAAAEKDRGLAGAPKTATKEAPSPTERTVARKTAATRMSVPFKPAVQAAAKPRQTFDAPARTAKRPQTSGAYRQPVEEPRDEPIHRTRVRKTEDEQIDAKYNEALIAMNSGRTPEAQRIFLSILARKPDHVESLNNMGVLAASSGKKKEALGYFKKILDYRNDYPKAYNNIGLIMMSEGDSQLAEEYFRKAISLDPNGLEPYMNLCALLRTQRRFQEAAKVLETPIKKDTKDPLLVLSYAVVKDNLGQSGDAIRYYRQYLGLAKPSEVRNGVVERLRYLEDRGKK